MLASTCRWNSAKNSASRRDLKFATILSMEGITSDSIVDSGQEHAKKKDEEGLIRVYTSKQKINRLSAMILIAKTVRSKHLCASHHPMVPNTRSTTRRTWSTPMTSRSSVASPDLAVLIAAKLRKDVHRLITTRRAGIAI